MGQTKYDRELKMPWIQLRLKHNIKSVGCLE